MITVVALLFLPALLALTVWRAMSVPRDLLAGRRRPDPRHPWRAAAALGLAGLALLAGTGWLLLTALQAALVPPATVQAWFALGRPVLAFPLLCLLFEWVLFHALVAPSGRAQGQDRRQRDRTG